MREDIYRNFPSLRNEIEKVGDYMKHQLVSSYFIFILLGLFCTPFLTTISHASSDYFDIISQDTIVSLDQGEQQGQEHMVTYENLFLSVVTVQAPGPLQGFLRIGMNYFNSGTNGRTLFEFNLEHLNFFFDLTGDGCQTWLAERIGSGYFLQVADVLIYSMSPFGNADWLKVHPELMRNSGITNYEFISFYSTLMGQSPVLNWGIKETLVFALQFGNQIYWNVNITLDFSLNFHFIVTDNVAYLSYESKLENCSIHNSIQQIYDFARINLALEWKTDSSVFKGLTHSPINWNLDNIGNEGVTAANISAGEMIDEGLVIGKIYFGTQCIKNNISLYPIINSAISLRSARSGNDFLSINSSTQLYYSQTISNYSSSDAILYSQCEFYFASSTLNIIFIVLFNVILSVIIVMKGFRSQRRGNS